MRRRVHHALEFLSSVFCAICLQSRSFVRQKFHFQENPVASYSGLCRLAGYEPTIEMQIEISIENDGLIYKHLFSADKWASERMSQAHAQEYQIACDKL